MDKKALREHIDRATKLVESWPSWKQDILARSSQPTLSVPRTPVDNQARSASAHTHKGS